MKFTFWKRFLDSPPWWRLVAGLILWKFQDNAPQEVEWLVGLMVFVCLSTGFVQLFYRMENRPLSDWLLLPLSSPVTAIAAFIALSLLAKEFFPLSHYPMYSNPSASAEYIHLAKRAGNGELQPVATKPLVGISTSKVGKIFRARVAQYRDEHGLKFQDVTRENEREVGEAALQYYQERAAAVRAAPKSGEEWALLRTSIRPDPETGIQEKTTVIATRKVP